MTDLLYAGEQWDADLGMQYLRARYYLPGQGVFNRLDPFFGNTDDPQSLHKYVYTHGDPVNGIDPSGLFTLGELTTTMTSQFNLISRILNVVSRIDTAIDSIMMMVEFITLFRSGILTRIRQEVAPYLRVWESAPPSWGTAKLFREAFWEDVASVVESNAARFINAITTHRGRRTVQDLSSIRNRDFAWVFYGPLPAETQLPVIPLRFRIPGVKIMGRKVILEMDGVNGQKRGRLFGIGYGYRIGKSGGWETQLFRFDYHNRHDTPSGRQRDQVNENIQGRLQVYNWHVPKYRTVNAR